MAMDEIEHHGHDHLVEIPETENTAVATALVLTTIGFAAYGMYEAGKKGAAAFVNWKQNRDREKNLKVVSDN